MWKVSVCVHDCGGTQKNRVCRPRHGARVRGSAERPHVAPRPARCGSRLWRYCGNTQKAYPRRRCRSCYKATKTCARPCKAWCTAACSRGLPSLAGGPNRQAQGGRPEIRGRDARRIFPGNHLNRRPRVRSQGHGAHERSAGAPVCLGASAVAHSGRGRGSLSAPLLPLKRSKKPRKKPGVTTEAGLTLTSGSERRPVTRAVMAMRPCPFPPSTRSPTMGILPSTVLTPYNGMIVPCMSTLPWANDSRVVFVLVPLLGALIPSSPLCSPGRPAPLRRYPTSSCAACPAPVTRHRAPPGCRSRRWARAAPVEGTRVKSSSVLPIRRLRDIANPRADSP
jgi:hypothetical protein